MRTKIPEIQKLRMNPEEGDYADNVTLGSENPVAEGIANDLPGLALQFMASDASMSVCDETEESPANNEEEEPMILSVKSAQEIRDGELDGCSNLNAEHMEFLSHADEPNEPSTSGQKYVENPSCVQSTPIEFETVSSSAPQHPILFGQEAECDYSLSPVSDDGKYKVWEETVEHEEMNNSVSAEQACGFIDEQQSMQEELPEEHAADTSDEGNNAKVPPEGEDARFSCVLCSARFTLEADVASHIRSHDISLFYRRVKRQDGMIVESEGDVDRKNDEVDHVVHDHCDSAEEGSGDVSHSELAQQPANDAHKCGQCDRRYGTKRGLDRHVVLSHIGKRKSTEVEMLRSSLQKYAAATVNLPERRRTVKESSGSDEAVKRPPKKIVGGNNSASRQVGSAPSYVCLHCLHVVSFEGRNVKSRYSAYQKMWKHVVSVHAKKTARTNVDFVTGLGAGNVPSSGRVLKAAAPIGNILCQKCGKGFQTNRARAIHAARSHRRKLLPYSNRKGKSDQQNVLRKTKNVCTRILSGKRKHSANATPMATKGHSGVSEAADICGAVFSCLYCVYEYRCILTKRECAEKHNNVIKGLWHSNAYQMIGYHVRKEHKKPCIQDVAYKLKSKEIQVTTPSSDIRASPRVSQHTQSPRKKAKTSPTKQPEVKNLAIQQQQCGIVYSCAHCTSFHATCELTKEDCVYRYYTRTGATQTKRHRFAEPRTRRHLLSKHDNITSFKLGIDYTRTDASESAFTIHGPTVVSCLHCSEFITECDGSLQHKKAIVAMHGHVRKKHSGTVVKRGVDYKVDTTATPAEKSITLKRKHPATVPSIAAKKKDNLVLSKTPRVSDPDQPCCSTQPSTSSPAKTKTASCVPVPATPTSSATATATTTSISFACTRCPYITSMYMDIRGHSAKEHPDAVAGRMIQNVLDYTKIFS